MRLAVLPTTSPATDRRDLMTELQAVGLRLPSDDAGAPSRRGGAGPSDHKAVTIDGQTLMLPVHTGAAHRSPYSVVTEFDGRHMLEQDGQVIAEITFPDPPRFYNLQTLDGIPYWKIAVLHSSDVLATTVMQKCIRYQPAETACQFCAIGQSLKADRTIARKTPEQLAEVARAAVRLDGVKHMILTTGTPNRTDRGARVLAESAFAIKGAIDLPIQAQCEPPDDFAWFDRLKAAGVDALGMHLEAVEPDVRARIMPGKAEVPVSEYMRAFRAAVEVFGWGQVSTYILAGLGDSHDAIVHAAGQLINIGVYPFVVPFVPISGTALADHPSPNPFFMKALLADVGAKLFAAGMKSSDIKAGCGKCGACSSLSQYEATRPTSTTGRQHAPVL
ncbi:MAG: MSMEG_0568 family radical SAM protein [Planctomycetota bacterium]